MTRDRRADEIIADIERTSRRARPFLILGLVVIVGSLLASIFYLNRARADAVRLAAVYKSSADESLSTLEGTREALQKGDLRRAHDLLGLAITQAQELASVAAENAPAPAVAVPRKSPNAPVNATKATDPAPRPAEPRETSGGQPGPIPASGRAIVVNNSRTDLMCRYDSGGAAMIVSGRRMQYLTRPGSGHCENVRGGARLFEFNWVAGGSYTITDEETNSAN